MGKLSRNKPKWFREMKKKEAHTVKKTHESSKAIKMVTGFVYRHFTISVGQYIAWNDRYDVHFEVMIPRPGWSENYWSNSLTLHTKNNQPFAKEDVDAIKRYVDWQFSLVPVLRLFGIMDNSGNLDVINLMYDPNKSYQAVFLEKIEPYTPDEFKKMEYERATRLVCIAHRILETT